ncbi:duf71 -containing protein [Anaeramoeba ignava]|uniref:Diphthine--ammonia ligase n=1 Tax=Anaeramoeba ignava TaxID=1746090 RepID=A0A9Q0R688_ANAIG|nr:duf71 -containing protein [Anaeramoeba ignava]
MKLCALISGGKDSFFSALKCVELGHEIVALVNLYPPNEKTQEMDSYSFQTVGHSIIPLFADCINLPLFRRKIQGNPNDQNLEYFPQTQKDEVEDLFALLWEVKKTLPEIEGVSCGAIFSDYQRTRVENVCFRLGLKLLSPMWRRNQKELMHEMISVGMDAIIIKVAAMGLDPKKHLGKTLKQMEMHFHQLNNQFGFHICGEGGEFESLVLDCPLFYYKIVIDQSKIVIHSDDEFAPVGYIIPEKFHLEKKEGIETKEKKSQVIESILNPPKELQFYYQDLEIDEKFQDPNLILFKSGKFIFSSMPIKSENDLPLDKQIEFIFMSIFHLLKKQDLSLEQIFLLEILLGAKVEQEQIQVLLNHFLPKFFPKTPPCVLFHHFSKEEIPVQIKFFADCTKSIKKTLFAQSLSNWAPCSPGFYSNQVLVHGMIFSSLIKGIKPMTNELNFENEFLQIIQNCSRYLEVFNSEIRNVILWKVFVSSPKVDPNELQKQIESFLNQNKSEKQKLIIEDLEKKSVENLMLIIPVEKKDESNLSLSIIAYQNDSYNFEDQDEIEEMDSKYQKILNFSEQTSSYQNLQILLKSVTISRHFGIGLVYIQKSQEDQANQEIFEFDLFFETILDLIDSQTNQEIKQENIVSINIYSNHSKENPIRSNLDLFPKLISSRSQQKENQFNFPTILLIDSLFDSNLEMILEIWFN